jgi:hypothetical protein
LRPDEVSPDVEKVFNDEASVRGVLRAEMTGD